MAIEFGKNSNLNQIRIDKDKNPEKKVEKEEIVEEQAPILDNTFVKEMGDDLLTANPATFYGVKINKPQGVGIDKEFWGDALDGLNLQDTEITNTTVQGISSLDNTFAILDMKNKMDNSKFMKALNKEFGI